jgi:hypothetical protein
MQENPLELVVGANFYRRKNKMFDQVVGFAKFSEFLVVAAVGFPFFAVVWIIVIVIVIVIFV